MLLFGQYEEARVNELDDTPAAIVLDQAVTPEYKWRPREDSSIFSCQPAQPCCYARCIL